MPDGFVEDLNINVLIAQLSVGCIERYTNPTGSGRAETTPNPAALKSTGRIRWASTETADAFNGHIEGAIRAGLAAAQELFL